MTDEAFRDLQERAHLVRELTQQPGWQVVADEIGRRTDARNRRLLDGQAETVEEYRAWAGWIQGAKAFLALPEELQQRVTEETKRRAEARKAA